MEIFDKFIVVDEKALTNFKSDFCDDHYCPAHHYAHFHLEGRDNCHECRSVLKKPHLVTFSDLTPFSALEFQQDARDFCISIKDIGNVFSTTNSSPLAQIIHWEWNGLGEQVIKEENTLDKGRTVNYRLNSLSSIVVRILKEKEETDQQQNPFPPLCSPDDDLTVQIGEEKITVSAAWLMSVSPMVRRMLSVEMKEKRERTLTLNDLDIDMEQFIEFLEAISLIALQTPILPTPKNVLILLKLADYFQVEWLKLRFETHLINCVEIPLIDRFLLIDRYQLNNFKKHFLNLNVDNLRAFYKANLDQLMPGKSAVSNGLLAELTSRLCG